MFQSREHNIWYVKLVRHDIETMYCRMSLKARVTAVPSERQTIGNKIQKAKQK